jgi:hypothetical protein
MRPPIRGACAIDACEQRIDPGPCNAAIPRWAFDADQGTCVTFVYGGCQANGNNFATEAECLASCGARVDVCELPAEVGPCDGAFPRWFHHSASGRCEQFSYGGCEGNANNFATLADCQGACLGTPRCELPVDPGPCRASVPRWYHDSETGACERFTYGGCAGNDNNFATQAACERACPLCNDSLCAEHQSCQLFRDPRCREQQKRCERICGDGCEQSCDPVPFCADTCDRGACPENTRCELVAVNCIHEPCPPVRHCIPIEDERCGDTVCGPFQECLRDPVDGERYCADTCDEGACPDTSVCTLEPVECVTKPCPPVRRCAPRDPCAGVQCRPGERCTMNQVGDPICVRD